MKPGLGLSAGKPCGAKPLECRHLAVVQRADVEPFAASKELNISLVLRRDVSQRHCLIPRASRQRVNPGGQAVIQPLSHQT